MDNVWMEKLAIQELCSRYSIPSTPRTPTDWRDASWPTVHSNLMATWFADTIPCASTPTHTRVLRGRHMTLNHIYEVDGDRAAGRATTVVSIATAGGYKIMGQSAYEDQLVKVNGEWKIRHRRVTNDHLVSDPSKPVNLADPDVGALVQGLIDSAESLARNPPKRGSQEGFAFLAQFNGKFAPVVHLFRNSPNGRA